MTANGNRRLGEVEYGELVARVRATVADRVPAGASVVVVSKGDAALLDMPGLTAVHFPQDGAGEYAGHHPVDSAAATAEIQALRRRGAEYLVIPATARWWLDFYDDFARHLANYCELVADVPDACLIYGLGQLRQSAVGASAIRRPQTSVDQIRDYLEKLISSDTSLVVLEAGHGVTAALGPLHAIRLVASEEPGEHGERLLDELKRLADGGADYLIVPRSADEWLDRSPGLAGKVEANCPKIADQRHLCRVFDLEGLREAV